ncbi:hypothetical protein [Mucilaginibacter panaciglaebae]
MRDRRDILYDLIHFHGRLNDILKEISQFTWDAETPVITMTDSDFRTVLEKCIEDIISVRDIEEWANALECRDDIEFADKKIHDAIFDLANPEINGVITKKGLYEIIRSLELR